MSGRGSYTKVGHFPPNFRFLRIGDTCVFKASNHMPGWAKDAEKNGKIVRIYLEGRDPHIIVAVDPTKHSLQSTLYTIFPKGHPEFNFFLKIRYTALSSKLNTRAREERKAAFQGDMFKPFMS